MLLLRTLIKRFPAAKGVFVGFHVDTFASKLYALHAKAQALFGCAFALQFNFAAGSYDALPRQRPVTIPSEQARHCPLIKRIACCCCDLAVGRDFSLRNGADDASESSIALLIFAQPVFQDASLQILWNSRPSHEQNCIKA